jgi:release factor glutamine methyltransferase
MEQEQGWSIGALLDWTAKHLAKKGSEYPRLDAEVLLAFALGCKRIDLYTRYAETAPEDARQRYRDLIRRRVEGCPVAYLVGRKEFFSLQFEVTPAVLIPRPETEFVVLECLRLAKEMAEPRVLDLGTGSGNIAVSVAHQHKGARISAVDRSAGAIAVAAGNAAKHGVADRVRFFEGDLFSPIPAGEQFDFILSNPPYIPHGELDQLPPGVRNYEPFVALDGGADGFAVFDRILANAAEFLTAGGHLILEIGSPQHEPARQRFAAHPEWQLQETIYDGSRHPRVLSARKSA